MSRVRFRLESRPQEKENTISQSSTGKDAIHTSRKDCTPLVPASDDEDPECGDSSEKEEEDDDISQSQSATSSARRFKVDWREVQAWCRKTQQDA